MGYESSTLRHFNEFEDTSEWHGMRQDVHCIFICNPWKKTRVWESQWFLWGAKLFKGWFYKEWGCIKPAFLVQLGVGIYPGFLCPSSFSWLRQRGTAVSGLDGIPACDAGATAPFPRIGVCDIGHSNAELWTWFSSHSIWIPCKSFSHESLVLPLVSCFSVTCPRMPCQAPSPSLQACQLSLICERVLLLGHRPNIKTILKHMEPPVHIVM